MVFIGYLLLIKFDMLSSGCVYLPSCLFGLVESLIFKFINLFSLFNNYKVKASHTHISLVDL